MLGKSFFDDEFNKSIKTFIKKMGAQPNVKITLTDGTSFYIQKLKATDEIVLMKKYDDKGEVSPETVTPYEDIRRVEILKVSGAPVPIDFLGS